MRFTLKGTDLEVVAATMVTVAKAAAATAAIAVW